MRPTSTGGIARRTAGIGDRTARMINPSRRAVKACVGVRRIIGAHLSMLTAVACPSRRCFWKVRPVLRSHCKEKFTETVMITGTARPSTSVGAKVHCRTASIAA